MQTTPKKPLPKQTVKQLVADVKKTALTKKELDSFVKEQVIVKLGNPPKLNFIKASNVFDNKWRVDVWCYFDSTETIMSTQSSKIKHSYFIDVNEHGKITNSSPEITKEY
jgi:hypothetical protein